MKGIGKTAVVSTVAGVITYFLYLQIREVVPIWGNEAAQYLFSFPKKTIVEFVLGSFTLGTSLMIYLPIYLLGMNLLGLIEDAEKQLVYKTLGKIRTIFGKENQNL